MKFVYILYSNVSILLRVNPLTHPSPCKPHSLTQVRVNPQSRGGPPPPILFFSHFWQMLANAPTHVSNHTDAHVPLTHSPERAATTAAMRNESIIAGPALYFATSPVTTYTPAPRVLPTPSKTRSSRVRHLCKSLDFMSLSVKCFFRVSGLKKSTRPMIVVVWWYYYVLVVLIGIDEEKSSQLQYGRPVVWRVPEMLTFLNLFSPIPLEAERYPYYALLVKCFGLVWKVEQSPSIWKTDGLKSAENLTNANWSREVSLLCTGGFWSVWKVDRAAHCNLEDRWFEECAEDNLSELIGGTGRSH